MRVILNYSFRTAFITFIIALSMLLPMYFCLPLLSYKNRVLLLVCLIIFSIIEILILIFIQKRTIIRPLILLNNISKNIIKGDYSVKVQFKAVDNKVNELACNFNQMVTEFENLEYMRKTFVSNASHELRSPLTSMQGFLQAVLDGTITSEEDKKKYLTIVLSETKRLSSLISSMLDLSRLESGKNPLTLTKFEINSVINQIVERFAPSLIKKEIDLNVDFARETNYVYADKEKIIQVLINLIDNAIKYSPLGSRILITTHIHNQKLYISVKDKGYGITKKDQALIWDSFYMTDKARTPAKSRGTGLGLAIVKKIIEEHKEIVWVESGKNAGSTFIFSLTLFDINIHDLIEE